MKKMELRFAGLIPEKYDELMVPLFFRPYADELAQRAFLLRPRRILETATGTGVATQALREALPEAALTATDLNPPMLEIARRRVGSEDVRFVTANAEALPFSDDSFDVLVCQFGAMFFPNKIRGHAEARRVLRDGGSYLLAIWDRIELNPLSAAAQQVLIEMFPNDPPLFMREGPFGYSDKSNIACDLHAAGFGTVEIETIELRSRSSSAHDVANALCHGTPMGVEINERAPGTSDRIFDAVEQSLRRFEGADGVDAPMSAHIVTAIK
jgi:ubiquinone/menaquinone biosynthesis C-methylase UbiE